MDDCWYGVRTAPFISAAARCGVKSFDRRVFPFCVLVYSLQAPFFGLLYFFLYLLTNVNVQTITVGVCFVLFFCLFVAPSDYLISVLPLFHHLVSTSWPTICPAPPPPNRIWIS